MLKVGEAYSAGVSEYITQLLINSYGNRKVGQGISVTYTGLDPAPAANTVSSFSLDYRNYGEKVAENIANQKYGEEILSVFPGGKDGFISEVSDMLSYIGRFDSEDAQKKLTAIEQEFLTAFKLALKNKQTNLQNAITYYKAVAEQFKNELPYGNSWLQETAQANVTVKYGTITKSEFSELYSQENQRLQRISKDYEDAQNTYQEAYSDFEYLAYNAQAVITSLLTELVSAVSTQITAIQGVNEKGYCTYQSEQIATYTTTIEKFDGQVQSVLESFNTSEETYWGQIDISALCSSCPGTEVTTAVMNSMKDFADSQEDILGSIITALQAQIKNEGGIPKTTYVPGFNYVVRTSSVQESRESVKENASEETGVGTTIETTLPTIPTISSVSSGFGNIMNTLEIQFSTNSPTSSDLETITNAIDNLNQLSGQEGADATQVSLWKSELNAWLKTALNSGEKKTYFAEVSEGFGEGSNG